MVWLYSVLISGLMFASGTNPANVKNGKNLSAEARQSKQTNVVKFDETDKFEKIYPFDANGTISVSNVNGSITVEAWDNPQIKLEVEKIADSRASLDDAEIKIDVRQNNFRVETDYKNNGGGWKNGHRLEINYRLTVPRSAILNGIETVNGSVAVSDLTNYTKVSAVNGAVTAKNLRGNADLSTVNGTVEADYQSVESVKKISLETVNGKAFLIVPSDINATLRADTVNGEISNDFGLPVRRGQYVGKDLYGRIGSGEVQIKMNSVNGTLSVKRRSDGKNPNPAINLLSSKSGANDDSDDESGVDADKINREIAKSVAESQRETAKAAREAAKEIRKAQVEINNLKINPAVDVTKVLDSVDVQNQINQAMQISKESLNWSGAKPFVEKKSETFTVKQTPKVTIDAKGCQVFVRGWEKSEVSYSLKRYSKIAGEPSAATKTSQNGDAIDIRVSGAAANYGGGDDDEGISRTRLEVFVPRKSDLKIVTDGEIRLEGVTGDLDLSGSDESINVRDAGGKLRVKADDGLLRVVGFDGELDAKMTDGEAYFEGNFSALSAVTSDGEIYLTLPENADAEIESNVKKISTQGITLTRQNGGESNRWQIGRGGAKYRLIAEEDGKITVRGKSALTVSDQ